MPKKGEVDLPKLKYWRAILADFERSGLSGQAYCRQKGIAYTAFANRRRRLAAAGLYSSAAKPKDRPVAPRSSDLVSHDDIGFVPVTVKMPEPESKSPPEKLEIVLQRGIVLRVPSGYSVETLVAVVSMLEEG